MRKILLLLAVASILAGSLASAATAGSTKRTGVRDDFFTKGKLTISAGTTVVWKWKRTEEPHTVTDTDKNFGSKRKLKGRYRHRFRKAGTYHVYCKVHPTTMRQKIVVR